MLERIVKGLSLEVVMQDGVLKSSLIGSFDSKKVNSYYVDCFTELVDIINTQIKYKDGYRIQADLYSQKSFKNLHWKQKEKLYLFVNKLTNEFLK